MTTLDRTTTMAKRKPVEDPSTPRDRIDLRAEPEWIEEVKEEARINGMGLSAFIRFCVIQQMNQLRANRTKR